MRIAYIILCHTDPEHIRRLTKKITGGTDDDNHAPPVSLLRREILFPASSRDVKTW